MTPADNIAIAPRADRRFFCWRIRSGAKTAIFPGAGSSLRFANRAADSFTAVGLPVGLLKPGDSVQVQRRTASGGLATVFSGAVDEVTVVDGKGDDTAATVVAAGPWSRLERLVFRQVWRISEAFEFSSSRVILNRSAAGLAVDMKTQLREILSFSYRGCGFSFSDAELNKGELAQTLPADEARDITCADAIRRLLRFHPKVVVWFDYEHTGTYIKFTAAGAQGVPAALLDSSHPLARSRTSSAHPISAVDVSVDAADSVRDGKVVVGQHQVYPMGADTSALDCLHVTVPLSPGGGSTSTETFDSVTEDIPADLGDAAWWKAKHPRLANVATSAITITEASRSPANHPRIAKAAKDAIERAGLHCEVSRFTCKCRIKTPDDEEEDSVLTMDFLTTDATTRRYTWQTGSSWEAGETLPEGLAKAIYDQQSGALVSERLTVRLGTEWPQLGQLLDGLFLQTFTVDLDTDVATLDFGRPGHLSVDDLRGLLTGFRQRGYASSSILRGSGDGEDEPDEDEDFYHGIPPLNSSEFAPGTKKKTSIKAASGAGGSIVLDSAAVSGTDKAEVKALKAVLSGSTPTQLGQLLSTKDLTLKGSGVKMSWDANSGALTLQAVYV